MSSDANDIRQDAEPAGVPETDIPWENTVRRFTGSIDVRLDILEDELGGLQDELSRLQQIAGERVDAAQRRLLRVYLAGQVLLIGLIVALFLIVWRAGGTDADPQPNPGASANAPEAGIERGSGNRLPGVMQAPMSETASPTETRTGPAAPQAPKTQEAGSGASSRASSARGIDAAAESEQKRTAVPQKPQEKSAAEPASASSLIQDKEPAVPVKGQSTASPTIQGEAAPESEGAAPAASQQSARPEEPQTREDPKEGATAETGASADGEKAASEPADSAIVLKEEHFAIQLVSYHSKSRVAAFAEEFGIASEARYMLSQNRGQDWYSVFLGVYRTDSEAAAVLESLPPRLRELGAWIRSLPAGTRLMPAKAPVDAASDN